MEISNLFAPLLCKGGLGVTNPVAAAPHVDLSVHSTAVLISIVYATAFELDAHIETVLLAKSHYCQIMSDIFADNFNCLLPSFDLPRQRAILRAKV